MTKKALLKYGVVFSLGLGVGLPGGFLLNDYFERENSDVIAEIREEFEEQQALDDFFGEMQREAQPRDTTDSDPDSSTTAPARPNEDH